MDYGDGTETEPMVRPEGRPRTHGYLVWLCARPIDGRSYPGTNSPYVRSLILTRI